MALIHVAYDFAENIELMDALRRGFESVEEIRDEPWRGVKILRVQGPEVTIKDKVICPLLYKFEGVAPFIIQYD